MPRNFQHKLLSTLFQIKTLTLPHPVKLIFQHKDEKILASIIKFLVFMSFPLREQA